MKNQIEIELSVFIRVHQKITLKITNTIETATAQNAGRCHSDNWPSDGISVTPITRPFNSLSGFGLVTMLTATVTITHTSHDHNARYMFSAMSLAWLESAT